MLQRESDEDMYQCSIFGYIYLVYISPEIEILEGHWRFRWCFQILGLQFVFGGLLMEAAFTSLTRGKPSAGRDCLATCVCGRLLLRCQCAPTHAYTHTPWSPFSTTNLDPCCTLMLHALHTYIQVMFTTTMPVTNSHKNWRCFLVTSSACQPPQDYYCDYGFVYIKEEEVLY